MHCTPGKAKKIVIGLTVVALISTAIIILLVSRLVSVANNMMIYLDIYAVVYLVLPSAVLVINLLVVHEVRRASNTASTTLGRHQSPHCPQATPTNSAVPTIMLITTSFIYVFLSSTWSVIHIWYFWLGGVMIIDPQTVYYVGTVLNRLIYGYNFFVYLITGRQFRSELRSLCCCCCATAAAPAPPAAIVNDAAVPTGREFITSSV